ncbi:MAG: hypothetical protein JSV36_04000 [Anaerolineae bacterium]|nr:MAG: hypothetical protein JSV36_04000 [Anaerolineae bacterium]
MKGRLKDSLHRWRGPALALLGMLVLLVIGSAVGESVAEENDAFCATCHLNPERTYVDRARTVAGAYGSARQADLTGDDLWQSSRDAARDLASSHRAAALNCVACHRGDNRLGDRVTALALGARNTFLYLTGQFDPDHSGIAQPGLVEASCLRCHVDQPHLGGVTKVDQNPVTLDIFDNHFHSYLFDAQYVAQTVIGCLDCHPSHLEIPPIVPYFIDEERVVLPACVQCHIDVQKGPVDL